MQRLEVSGAVRPLYGSLGVKGLTLYVYVKARIHGSKYVLRPTLLPASRRPCDRLLPDSKWLPERTVNSPVGYGCKL